MKERLVGAAVLVAIGVWLIPWVLDGPESPLDTGANSLQLPAAEEPMPMRTQTLRLGAEAPTLAAPVVDAPVAAAGRARAAPEPPVAPHTESPESGAAPGGATAVAEAAPQPRAQNAAPARREAAAVAPGAAAGDWVVQLGSFGEEANARRLAERAGTFGYQAVVASIRSNGRTLYRVRVGPIENRGQADATASALGAHGFVAKVVAADR